MGWLHLLSLQDAKKGLQDGSLFQGKLRINTRRRSTAFVTADGGVLPSDIFLQNEKARNRAQEGDLVCATESLVRSPSYTHDSCTDPVASSQGLLTTFAMHMFAYGVRVYSRSWAGEEKDHFVILPSAAHISEF